MGFITLLYKRRYMIYQGLFDLGQLFVVILCITSLGKCFSHKLHSLDSVLSTVFVLILEQLLMPKVLYFLCFGGRSVTSTYFPDYFFS